MISDKKSHEVKVEMVQENFPNCFNDRFLSVISQKAVDKTPVWIMRQAGRYLPGTRFL
jgi:uroporphyrinogen-III decarboxylase